MIPSLLRQQIMRAKQQCSLQNLITMDVDESVYKHCIEDVKSPFQVLQLERTGFTEDLTQYKDAINRNQNKKEVSSFMGDDREEGEASRERKRIFSGKSKKQQSGFWPQLYTAVKGLVCTESVSPSPPLQQPPRKPPQPKPTNPTDAATTPLPASSRVFPPLTYPNPSPINQSLYYNNPSLPAHQQDFIEFILKVLPKLFLKSTVSSKIYAQKSEVISALLGRLQNEDKYKVLQSMFGNDNLKRIDRRVKAGNVSRFLEELTDMSKEPMKEEQKKRITQGVQKMIELLCEVEDDIRSYLTSGNRVSQLQQIYDRFLDLDPRPKKLISQLQSFLNHSDILCTQRQLQPLSYIWHNIRHRFYTKQQFVGQLTRNDYIIGQQRASQEVMGSLQRQGYTRN